MSDKPAKTLAEIAAEIGPQTRRKASADALDRKRAKEEETQAMLPKVQQAYKSAVAKAVALCCSQDLTDLPDVTGTMAVDTRTDRALARADIAGSYDANQRLEKLERENKELKSKIKRLEALAQDGGAVAAIPKDSPTQ